MTKHNSQNNNSTNTKQKPKVISVVPSLYKGFTLGNVIIEPELGVVIRDGERYHLAPKAMKVLLFLASGDNQILSREQILEFGWDNNASQNNVTHIISEIRHVLDDHKESPKFIQTIPRKGYRMILPTRSKELTHTLEVEDPSLLQQEESKWSLSFSLLKSSRLFKASATYIVFSWVMLQVVSLVLPIFEAPDWTVKFSTLVLIVGFPLVVGFQWLGELKQRRKKNLGKQSFFIKQLGVDSIFVLLVLSIIYYLSTHLVTFIEIDNLETKLQETLPETVSNAVVVMPFSNDSDDKLPNYITSGLQDELVNQLTRRPEFLVASIRATNALEPNASVKMIRDRLGVKYILEGKAKQLGKILNITATLIDSVTGFQVWSFSLEGNKNELLIVYEQLSKKVLSALNLLIPSKQYNNDNTMPTQSFEAYDAYLQGKDASRKDKELSSLKVSEHFFKTAIDLDPNFHLASSGLCKTYMQLYRVTDDINNYHQGVDACELTASYKEVSLESYLALGELHLIKGDYDKAIDYLKLAKELEKNNPEVLLLLAKSENMLNNLDIAEQLFTQVIALEPSYWGNYFEYGLFLYNNGRYKESIALFNKLNLLNNKVVNSYNALGGAYFLIGDIENAYIAWSKGFAIKPTGPLYANLGTSLFFLQQFDNAIEMYKQSLEILPLDNILWANLGDSYKYSDQSANLALEAYQKALTLALKNEQVNLHNIELQAQISRYYSELNQCDNANVYAQKALVKNVSDPYIYYDLAIAALNCQQLMQAKNMIEKVLELNYSKTLLLADPQFLAYKEDLTHLFQN